MNQKQKIAMWALAGFVVTGAIFFALGSLINDNQLTASIQSTAANILKIAEIDNWKVEESTHPIDDSPLVTMTVSAYDESVDSLAQLTLRCMQGKASAYFTLPHHLFSRSDLFTEATTRVDSESAITQPWIVVHDARALFTGEPEKFINALLKNDKILLQFTPEMESTRLIEFTISGLENHIGKLTSICNKMQASPNSP